MKRLKLVALIISICFLSIASNAQEAKHPDGKGDRKGRPSVEELFTQMDSNKDDKLAKKEVQGPLADDFDIIDKNKDGFITKQELKKAPKPKREEQGRPPMER